jgi:hypothetical protein
MKHISFNDRFVNESRDDLIPGKVHTIRSNYDFWKRFEGKDIALFTWNGPPYRKGSKQKIFCVKKIVYVQRVFYIGFPGYAEFRIPGDVYKVKDRIIPTELLAKNDGFLDLDDFNLWFRYYKHGEMAILHFTDFRYAGSMQTQFKAYFTGINPDY